ncbi:2'-5' RNA ligase family protein [Hymenobacter koreensis]|uniref:2'-5' RNA ligase family protein n=1 Tax=Hymenobacter koreensis TaxID=1084523 RepID=A0ABP8J8Y4_9BACT
MTETADSLRIPPSLYLVALLPPEPVFSAVWAMKQEIHERTGSRNAVRLPPHITLIPPLRLRASEFEPLALPALAAFAAGQHPFRVGLHDFAWFGHRTLFVHVSDDSALQTFHRTLTAWCRQHLPAVPREKRAFTAHMTLATRDLPPDQVPALKLEFAQRSFQAQFEVGSFALFRHNGRQWEAIAEFHLGSGAAGL